MPQTPLLQLRLRQLRDLAAAFEIEILQNGTKAQILPAMLAAEQTGVFRTTPKNRLKLARAGWSHDDRQPGAEYTEPPWVAEEVRTLSEIKESEERGILQQKNPTIRANTDGWTKLRADVKEKMGDDFKIWGKNKAELERIMEDGN